MKRCAALLWLAGALALAQAAPAPEAITIKFKYTNEGESVLLAKQDTTSAKAKITDGDGKVLVENNENSTETAEYKETVLKRQEKKPPTKLERAYSKAEKKKGDTIEDLGLKGKTVVIEQKDGAYTFAFKDGGEVTGAAAEMLTQEFARKKDSTTELERLLLPKTAVKAGEEWKLDMAALAKEFGKDGEGAFDVAKSSGTGKLLKVYAKDGKQFGEMQFKVEMPIKSMGKEGAQIKFADGAKFVMDMTVDWCIDGSLDAGTMKAKMTMTGTGTLDSLPGSTVALDLTMETQQTQKEPAK